MTDKKLKGILKKWQRMLRQDEAWQPASRSVAASCFRRFSSRPSAPESESGNLSKAFETMYQHYDKQVKMRAKVRNALIYPVFVLALAVVVVIVLMVKVVPTFMDIFASYDAELPLITQSLILISNFFRKYIFLIIVVFAAIALIFKLYANTEKGQDECGEACTENPGAWKCVPSQCGQ
ncbi:MAG: type II secretion system F family protein [Ruminococcus sp.]